MNEMTNSHILVHEFTYLEPRTVDEAVALLHEHGDRAKLLAGGTDLLVQLKIERIKPDVVIAIHKLPGLKGIVRADGETRIGALTTIRAIRENRCIGEDYPALADACRAFSTTQVQVMGTVGGNLCNGSPASDSAPPLIAFGAELELTGPAGVRRVPAEDFFTGPGQTVLGRDELLTSIILPAPRPGAGSAFLKMSRVAADIAKANAAVALMREGDRIVDCRLAYGSVAPTPMRAKKAESLLTGQLFTPELVARAAQTAADEITPIDDVRSTAWYRRQVVDAMTQDGLNQAWARADDTAYSVPVLSGVEGLPTPDAGEEARYPQSTIRNPQSAIPIPHSDIIDEPATGATVTLRPDEKRRITLMVNGVQQTLWVAANDLLLNVLREDMELTGARYGCGIGECGACTVQLNGKPTLACLVLAVAADGGEVVTVEGLQAPDGTLDPLQEAFLDHAAYQCGFCTPGMLMTAKTLLTEVAQPTDDDVRDYLKGNLCRCTGYASIIRAVLSAAERHV
ncbi:MAG: hypothetical protein CVU38_07480 [Chloroflexi bacterium HGW-Chloroflexi-1]|nr:MAG: hypothetical protein CVU38_07480 [Chloroflexi bacterium HGW-Chloroflexi-1]